MPGDDDFPFSAAVPSSRKLRYGGRLARGGYGALLQNLERQQHTLEAKQEKLRADIEMSRRARKLLVEGPPNALKRHNEPLVSSQFISSHTIEYSQGSSPSSASAISNSDFVFHETLADLFVSPPDGLDSSSAASGPVRLSELQFADDVIRFKPPSDVAATTIFRSSSTLQGDQIILPHSVFQKIFESSSRRLNVAETPLVFHLFSRDTNLATHAVAVEFSAESENSICLSSEVARRLGYLNPHVSLRCQSETHPGVASPTHGPSKKFQGILVTFISIEKAEEADLDLAEGAIDFLVDLQPCLEAVFSTYATLAEGDALLLNIAGRHHSFAGADRDSSNYFPPLLGTVTRIVPGPVAHIKDTDLAVNIRYGGEEQRSFDYSSTSEQYAVCGETAGGNSNARMRGSLLQRLELGSVVVEKLAQRTVEETPGNSGGGACGTSSNFVQYKLHLPSTLWGRVQNEAEFDKPRIALRVASDPPGCVDLFVAFPPLDGASIHSYQFSLFGSTAQDPLEISFVEYGKQVLNHSVAELEAAIEQPNWKSPAMAFVTLQLVGAPTASVEFSSALEYAKRSTSDSSNSQEMSGPHGGLSCDGAVPDLDTNGPDSGLGAADAATSRTIDATRRKCSNCRRSVAADVFELHIARCAQFFERCEVCSLLLRRSNFASHTHCPSCGISLDSSELEHHVASKHQITECLCGLQLERGQLHAHRRSCCPERIIRCRFCNVFTKAGATPPPSAPPANGAEEGFPGETAPHQELLQFNIDDVMKLTTHERLCGCKTAECPFCFSRVMRKELDVHFLLLHPNEGVATNSAIPGGQDSERQPQYICPICPDHVGASFNSRSSLERHLKRHLEATRCVGNN